MKDSLFELEIKQEHAQDFPAIYDVNTKAFGRKEEARLVDRLRLSEAFVPELSLIAIVEGKVVGHILFSIISIVEGECIDVSLALAPVAVAPDWQGKGIGSRLIRYGLDKAKQLGYRSAFVLGHSAYYPKFGFKPSVQWGIRPPFNVPSEVFMAIELVEGSLSCTKGEVRYAKEFAEL